MTWPGSGADLAGELSVRTTGDGSFSLFSDRFGEAFHAAAGAQSEARNTFVGPAELERFAPGTVLQVLDVCVGTGSNTAALLEACAARALRLQWHGLELDPQPLRLALADEGFCGQWRPEALEPLGQLVEADGWSTALGHGLIHWGDARAQVPLLAAGLVGQVDLVLMDAFSPRHCPELWTLEFLGRLVGLLKPSGRLLTYCSAAALRATLQHLGLHLAAITSTGRRWSGGTVASPGVLPDSSWLRSLTPMESEHLLTNAAVPYRDPTGAATAAAILVSREARQQELIASGLLEPTSAWRRRWGLLKGPI